MDSAEDRSSSFNDLPEDLPLDRPNAARIYDFFLGGYHNFAVDRQAAARVLEVYPDAGLSSQINRAFLRRCVRFLLDQGIRQFLDIGSGIPTVGNVHEIVQEIDPQARVLYVDIDPVAVAHSEEILRGNSNCAVIQADLRSTEEILDHPRARELLDYEAPMATLLLLMLHFIGEDEQVYRAARTLREAMASGSYLAVTHGTYDKAPPDVMAQLRELSRLTPTPPTYRTRAHMEEIFDGFDLVEPGIVHTPLWRPEGSEDLFLDRPERSLVLAGVGVKS